LLRLDRRHQQAEARRCHGCGAHRLEAAERHQPPHAGREAAREAGQDEDREAADEPRLLPVAIGEAAHRDQQGGEHHGVRVEDPAQLAEADGVEVARDLVERDVDDEEVDPREEGRAEQDERRHALASDDHSQPR
jgi:hypothetical protein